MYLDKDAITLRFSVNLHGTFHIFLLIYPCEKNFKFWKNFYYLIEIFYILIEFFQVYFLFFYLQLNLFIYFNHFKIN